MDALMDALQKVLVQDVGEQIDGHLAAIAAMFKPGAKLTLLVRRPEKPDGSHDVILSDDHLALAIGALVIRLQDGVLAGAAAPAARNAWPVLAEVERAIHDGPPESGGVRGHIIATLAATVHLVMKMDAGETTEKEASDG